MQSREDTVLTSIIVIPAVTWQHCPHICYSNSCSHVKTLSSLLLQ